MELGFSQKNCFIVFVDCVVVHQRLMKGHKKYYDAKKDQPDMVKKQCWRGKCHLITALNNYSFVSACLKDSDFMLKRY